MYIYIYIIYIHKAIKIYYEQLKIYSKKYVIDSI